MNVDLFSSIKVDNMSVNACSAGKAECVKDVPVPGGSVQDWRPGLFYGVDDQCRIAFGSSATACSFTHDDMVSKNEPEKK